MAKKLAASPEHADSAENSRSDGTTTRLRPHTSERCPMTSDDSPQAMPSVATRTPMSCGCRFRSPSIVDERIAARSASTQRSSPTRPKPSVISTTAFHS